MSALKALICTRSNVVLWSGSFHSSPNWWNGETPYNTRSLLGQELLPYTCTFALASDKEANWELLINTFFFGIAFLNCTTSFSPREISAVLKTLQKSLILQLRLQNKPIQICLSFQVYSDTNVVVTSSIFSCGEKLHQSTNLPTFQKATSLHLSNSCCMQLWGSARTSGPFTQ